MDSPDWKKARKLQAIYNIVPNLFWSILNLTPISVFCYTREDALIFIPSLAISFLPAFLSSSAFDKLQLSKSTRIYRKLGVPAINRFTQNGLIIKALIRRKYPHYQLVSATGMSVSKLVSQTYVFEKFHYMMFVFFSLTIAYAIVKGYLLWAGVIFLNNIIYNIYPNLLQQYIRLRLKMFSKKPSR